MKFRFLILVFLLTLLNQTIRADDDRQVWAVQVAAGAVLNVKDAPFNAKGNGATDDTAALQAAIDAACLHGQPTAKILLIPPGTYLVSSTLRVHNTRYFRMVGGGGATNLRWCGNSTDPALAIVNASFSEFSNFGISANSAHPLNTGVLLANDPGQPGQSTGNTFRNFGVGSNLRELRIGLQIGRPEGGELKNDGHRFLNCAISNFTDQGIVVRSPVAQDLLFYNQQVRGQNANTGLHLEGGSFYYLNGGISHVQIEFVVTAPTGPIEINFTNAEGCGRLLQAQAAPGGRLDLGLDNNRFANSPDPNFVSIDGPGNIRITRNQFNNYRATTAPLYPGSPNGFCILRTGGVAGDVFEYQYNRIFGFSPAQKLTSAGLFPAERPTQSCENHYWGWPLPGSNLELVAGRYDSTPGPPQPANTKELDRQLARVRGLSDSQALFIGRTASKATSNSATGGVAGMVNVRDYNAKGDGVTDDTAAFKSAIRALKLADWFNTGLVLVPAGNYVISETLLVDSCAVGFQIVGAGSDLSRLLWKGSGGTIVDFAGVIAGEIRGIGIDLAAGSTAVYGLRLRSSPGKMIAAYSSIADVVIDGSAGTLTTALKVGDGADVANGDANNDFHVFQDVVVSGYRNTGMEVINSQIYNLLFLDCRVDGALPGAGFVSQTGVRLVAGTLAWFGGGGMNHSVTTLEVMTDGNAPVLFHDAAFSGSPQLLNTGGPNYSMIFLNLDHVRFKSSASANQFISFSRPGVFVVENCSFELNTAQTLHHFGDQSGYHSQIPEVVAAFQSLNSFAFLGNNVVSATATAANFFVGSPPTVLSGNQFLPGVSMKPFNLIIAIEIIP